MALAACAFREEASEGRRYREPRHPYRGEFQRDRDRIIHARAFRRLENKTQVFSRRVSDHFRNRLTHTLEVAQVSRTVAGATGLNADLVETLALAHDIGHPPFGHAGERALHRVMAARGYEFDHNRQALRTVEELETRYAAFPGLNLTFEVREGLVKHSHDYAPGEHPELAEYRLDQKPPVEAQIIDLTDEISYGAADLDDGYEAGLLTLPQMAEGVGVFARRLREVDAAYSGLSDKLRFNETLRRVLDGFVTDLIASVQAAMAAFATVEEVRRAPARVARFSAEADEDRRRLKGFLAAAMYDHPRRRAEIERSEEIVTAVYEALLADPEALPAGYRARPGPLPVAVCDYVAGMTDSYITRLQPRVGKPAGVRAEG